MVRCRRLGWCPEVGIGTPTPGDRLTGPSRRLERDDVADERLGVQQRAVLLTLMVEAREVSNPELKELAGFTLDGERRRLLNERKLVDSRRVGRAYAHELTEAGWRWCAEELSARRPPHSGSFGGAMYATLANLLRFLKRSNLRLSDIFGRDEDGAAPPHQPAAATSLGRPEHGAGPAKQNELKERGMQDADQQADPDTDIEARVRAAYQKLAARPRGWVSLTDLRPLLGNASKVDVDATLRRMLGTPGVSLVPEANQKTLTGQDRAAAVRIGPKDHHLLAIDEP